MSEKRPFFLLRERPWREKETANTAPRKGGARTKKRPSLPLVDNSEVFSQMTNKKRRNSNSLPAKLEFGGANQMERPGELSTTTSDDMDIESSQEGLYTITTTLSLADSVGSQGLSKPPMTPEKKKRHSISVQRKGIRVAIHPKLRLEEFEPSVNFFEENFKKSDSIGSGSFGFVYKALRLEDNQMYAVKISKREWKSQSQRENSWNQLSMVALLRHPNLVHFEMAWEQDNLLHIAMELCIDTLEKGIKREKQSSRLIPEPMIWNYITDIALGLRHLHDRNILHLDIKPGNIFVTTSNELKLGDFGLAAPEGDDKHEEGDSRYLAPEFLEDGEIKKAADIFAFGMTIIEMGTHGPLPQMGKTWQELRRRTEFSKKPILEPAMHYSPALHNLVSRMIHQNPNRRATVDDIFKEEKVRSVLRNRGETADGLRHPIDPVESKSFMFQSKHRRTHSLEDDDQDEESFLMSPPIKDTAPLTCPPALAVTRPPHKTGRRLVFDEFADNQK